MAPQTLADVLTEQRKWSYAYDLAYQRRERAEKRMRQAQRHLGMSPMVKQIRDLLAPAFPEYRLEVLGPFGITHRCSIHAYVGDETVGILSFRSNSADGLVIIDYSSTVDDYPRGSIGALNGLNYGESSLPADITALADLLKKSIDTWGKN